MSFSEALSAELFQATGPELLERLAAEHDNVRAALVWLDQQGDEETIIRLAAGLGWFWFVRGFGTEGISWLERARSPRSAVAGPFRAAALNWASVLTLPRKDHVSAAELAALSVSLLRENGDESTSLAMALLSQGRATGYSGDRAKGTALLEESLALARVLDHPLFIGASLDSLAEFAFLDGDLEQSDHPRDRGSGYAAPPSTPVGDLLLARLARGDCAGTLRSVCCQRLLQLSR